MNGVVLECGCGWSASAFGEREVLNISVCLGHAHEMSEVMDIARDKLVSITMSSELKKGGILLKDAKRSN